MLLSWLKILILICALILNKVLGLIYFSLSHGSGFSKTIITLGADDSSSVHADNRKKNILILGKGQGFHAATLTAKAEYYINFCEKQYIFCLSLHYSRSNTPLLLGNISKEFSVDNIVKLEYMDTRSIFKSF